MLLNSDTLVAPGWLEALRAVAYSAPDIGTVTPLSNDATIVTYRKSIGRISWTPFTSMRWRDTRTAYVRSIFR